MKLPFPVWRFWLSVRHASRIGRPTTRILGMLDAIGHGLHIPWPLLRPLCERYDRRLFPR